MADVNYPQIPSSVWWGVRQLLQKSPRVKLDESSLAAALSVQTVAAKQYLKEFQKVGILDDDGRGTDLAGKWRMDDSYAEAIQEIAKSAYPDTLIAIAPPEDVDRQLVVNWFMNQGLGEGTARNKAAFYVLLTSPEPNSAPRTSNKTKSVARASDQSVPVSTGAKATKGALAARSKADKAKLTPELMPLNVNLQIHISADASSDQIEAIFAAMGKYLRNA